MALSWCDQVTCEHERAVETALNVPKAFRDTERYRHLEHVELDLYRKARQPREQEKGCIPWFGATKMHVRVRTNIL